MPESQNCPICRGPIHGPRSFVVCPQCAVQLGGVSVGSGQVDPLARRLARPAQIPWRPAAWCFLAVLLLGLAAYGIAAAAPWLTARSQPDSDEVYQRTRIFVRRYLETPGAVHFSDGVLIVPRGVDAREGFHSWGISGFVNIIEHDGPRREKFYAKVRYYPNERWTLELLRVGSQIAHEGGYVRRERRNADLNALVDLAGVTNVSRVTEQESGLRGQALDAWNRARGHVARGMGDVLPLRPLTRHEEAGAWVFSFHVDRFHWKYGWNRRYVTCVIHAGPADALRPVVVENAGANWVPIAAPRGKPLVARG